MQSGSYGGNGGALSDCGCVLWRLFAVWFADRRLELILVLEARDRIEMVLMPLMSIALMSVNYGALTVLYVQLDRKRQNKERWKFEAGEHAGLRG